MIKTDENALICDLAETYHIYDYKQLPLSTVAVFASGLSNNSRIKLKMNGLKISLETMFLAQILDDLNILVWSKTKDSKNGKNKPKSIYRMLVDEPEERKELAFESGEDFLNTRNKLLRQIRGDE
ncbi:hypothetical protein SAMN04488558_10390 [Ignavigranum ruoffiae]|uniref:Phage protein n=1 Tax=Ignavigranum ruoffiae TaxID=89093 RepID=A0A1H9BSQ1_9LACT|nr:hypothetical protein SAMN04488558_10390 [Ignavigranum ruoffiae]